MNLAIDAGNTSVKVGVFNKARLIFKAGFALEDLEANLEQAFSHHPIAHTMVSSVSKLEKKAVSFIESQCPLLWLDAATKVPFKNKYKTPKTLGVDRIALTAAAVGEYPKENVLVIDAGTCVTYDFKDAEETYLGGAISPGIQMRYKAMHDQTANLPLLLPEKMEHFIGSTTESAMHVGVTDAMVMEIDGMISKYKVNYHNLTVILTGGDASFLSKSLKNTIFAVPDFLLMGMNYILEFNSNQ